MANGRPRRGSSVVSRARGADIDRAGSTSVATCHASGEGVSAMPGGVQHSPGQVQWWPFVSGGNSWCVLCVPFVLAESPVAAAACSVAPSRVIPFAGIVVIDRTTIAAPCRGHACAGIDSAPSATTERASHAATIRLQPRYGRATIRKTYGRRRLQSTDGWAASVNASARLRGRDAWTPARRQSCRAR